MRRSGFVLALVFAVAGPTVADVSRWHGLATVDYAQCYSQAQCCNDPLCTEHHLVFAENCFSSCGGAAICSISGSVLYADTFTRITSNSGHQIFDGDFGPGSMGRVDFLMADPDTLALEYRLRFGQGQAPPLQPPLPGIEVAVFRFAGDPSVFDSLGALNLGKLVDNRVISNDDVLFVDTLTEDGTLIDANVDVAGIPPSEIVVMASGFGVLALCPPPLVPATGPWAALVLLLTLLAVSAIVLRRAGSRRERTW